MTKNQRKHIVTIGIGTLLLSLGIFYMGMWGTVIQIWKWNSAIGTASTGIWLMFHGMVLVAIGADTGKDDDGEDSPGVR